MLKETIETVNINIKRAKSDYDEINELEIIKDINLALTAFKEIADIYSNIVKYLKKRNVKIL